MTASRSPFITASLAAIAALAVIVPAIVVSNPPAIPSAPHKPVVLAKLQRRVVPPAELPPVEPVDLVALTPDEARAFNASVPFSADPNPAARPFRFAGPPEEKARALDCLAAAVIYEAGDDAPGERAVAQVVLNRLRHPAFPKTICGVVFEGAERRTGCQFTFTCDGALTRWKPSEAGWRRAREVATMALAGHVDRGVGYATHYHTDWVVPYWQSSLDKIAAVRTHLFFRWSGWWGTPPAFNRHQAGSEPVEEKIAALSDAHNVAATLEQADQALAEAAALTGPAEPVALKTEGSDGADVFLIAIDPRQPADGFLPLVFRVCGDRPRCSLMGWSRPALVPKALPLTAEQVSTMSFSYLRDRPAGIDKPLWNCTEFNRPNRAQCMKKQVLMTASPVPTAVHTQNRGSSTPAAGAELEGVRRRSRPATPPDADKTPRTADAAPMSARPATPPRTSPVPTP